LSVTICKNYKPLARLETSNSIIGVGCFSTKISLPKTSYTVTLLITTLPKPKDCVFIYLRSSIPNLVGQIHKRSREYENSISY